MNYLINNKVVRSYEGKSSIIGQMVETELIKGSDGDKVLATMIYLYKSTNREGLVKFTLRDLVEDSGYVLRGGKGRTQETFKIILATLSAMDLFGESETDFYGVKPNDLITISADNLLSTGENGFKDFVIITDEEMDIIDTIDGVDTKNLLLQYATIKSRINIGTEAPSVCYPTKEQMAKDTGFSEKSIQTYIAALETANLIATVNAGTFTKTIDGKVKHLQSANTYATTSTLDYELELDKSVEQYVRMMTRDYQWNHNVGESSNVCYTEIVLPKVEADAPEFIF